MDPTVPYEPILGKRLDWTDRVAFEAIKLWYTTPLHRIPTYIRDRLRNGEQAPVEGTPGAHVPDPAGAFKVAMMGDIGEASPAQARVAAQILGWRPTHVGTLGDNVYPTGREIDWLQRFDPYVKDLRRVATFQPALGNHDYYNADLTPYFQRFPHLDGKPFYTWTNGPAQFFVLDTELRLDGASAQNAWLAAELQRSTAPYKVIQMHRPMVSSNAAEIGRNMFGALGPLLAKHGVQLVLAGHEHTYERSKPINGTTHIVSGGGGAALSGGYSTKMPAGSQVRAARAHHIQLAYDAAQMVVRAVDDRGAVIDTMVVQPAAAVAGEPRATKANEQPAAADAIERPVAVA